MSRWLEGAWGEFILVIFLVVCLWCWNIFVGVR